MAPEFERFLEDLFAPVGGVRLRRMFSGHGVYRDGLMFALVSDGVVYLKADATSRPAFEAEGAGPFRYVAKGKTVALSRRRPGGDRRRARQPRPARGGAGPEGRSGRPDRAEQELRNVAVAAEGQMVAGVALGHGRLGLATGRAGLLARLVPRFGP